MTAGACSIRARYFAWASSSLRLVARKRVRRVPRGMVNHLRTLLRPRPTASREPRTPKTWARGRALAPASRPAAELPVAKAGHHVIVHEPARLHERVAGRGPDEPKASILQVAAHRPR